MIKRYRKKQVVIEAVKWDGGNFDEIEEFCKPMLAYMSPHGDYGRHQLIISTLGLPWKPVLSEISRDLQAQEVEHAATVGDFIIKGAQGECHPCKPDIFEKTCEVVEDG